MRPLSLSSSQHVLGIAWHNVLLTSLTLLISVLNVRSKLVEAYVKCSFPALGIAMSALSWLMKTRTLKGRRTGLTIMQCAEYDMTRSSLIFISFTVLSENTTANILEEKRKFFFVGDILLFLKYNDKIKLYMYSV